VERLAPIKIITIRLNPTAVWFDEECRKLSCIEAFVDDWAHQRPYECAMKESVTTFIQQKKANTGKHVFPRVQVSLGNCGKL